MRRVLLASVTNKGPEIIGPHVESIRNLEIPKDVSVDAAYVSDGAPEESLRIIHDSGATVADALPKPEGASYAVSEVTHDWTLPTFGWLAMEKQRLLDHAVEEGYDFVFFVDSDLILGPETLASLLAAQKPIVSAVFWTRWQPDAPPLPQVWLSHPYEFQGRSGSFLFEPHEFLRRLNDRELVAVGGLGACTLIRTDVLDRVRFFPLVEGLPQGGMWQGEDRSFCIRASRAHVGLWADAWPDINHLYRPSDVHTYKQAKGMWPKRKTRAMWGDDVSVILEALEEPELAKMGRREHLRGRLGRLRLLPEIEEAILETPVGEERIVRVDFPMWWSLEELRGKTKAVMVRVLDVKEVKVG